MKKLTESKINNKGKLANLTSITEINLKKKKYQEARKEYQDAGQKRKERLTIKGQS